MELLMRRAALVVLIATLSGGCSFVYDFDQFYAADAAVGVDAGVDAHDGAAIFDAAPDGEVDVDAEVPLTPELFLELVRQLACTKALRCTNKLLFAEYIQLLCHEDVGRDLFALQFLGTIDPARFDRPAAEACLLALYDTDCSLSNEFLSECDDALRGDTAVGSSCLSSYDCASGACVEQESMCGRICETRRSIGVLCSDNAECEPQLRCRDGTCQTPGNAADVCDQTNDCGTTLWCPRALRLCTIVPNDGEACALDLSGDPCRGSLVCTLGVCAVGGDRGGSCDMDRPCRPGFRCSPTTSVCVDLVGPGGPCLSGQNCPSFHECMGDVCVAFPALGEPCSGVLPCLQGVCVPGPAGTCTLQLAGPPCSGDNGPLGGQCEGYCRDEGGGAYACVDLLPLDARCVEDAECAIGSECIGPAATAACAACVAP